MHISTKIWFDLLCLTPPEFIHRFFLEGGGVCVAYPFRFLCSVFVSCLCLLCPCCCDVRYDFHVKTMFGSYLSSVVCMELLSNLCLLCLFADSCVQRILAILWIIRLMSYMRQALLALRRCLGSPPVFWWGPCCLSL
jgi:hypothetical protein